MNKCKFFDFTCSMILESVVQSCYQLSQISSQDYEILTAKRAVFFMTLLTDIFVLAVESCHKSCLSTLLIHCCYQPI